MGRTMITGIDLGHSAIRAVTLKPMGNHFVLMGYRELPVTAGIFTDNPKQNYQEIVKKLKELRKGLPIFSRRVSLAVPDNSVINKLIQVDSELSATDVEFSIAHALSHQSTLAMDEIEFDYVPVLEQSPLSDHTSYQVYATKRELIESRQAWLKGAGFKPWMFDTKARSLVQLWQFLAVTYQRRDYLLLNVEQQQVQLAIDFFDAAPFMRSFSLADNTLAEELRRAIERLAIQPGCQINGIWLAGEGSVCDERLMALTQLLSLPCHWLSFSDLVRVSNTLKTEEAPSGAYALAFSLALRGMAWLEQRHA